LRKSLSLFCLVFITTACSLPPDEAEPDLVELSDASASSGGKDADIPSPHLPDNELDPIEDESIGEEFNELAEPSYEGYENETTGEIIGSETVPVWDRNSRKAALDAAEKVVRAYGRPDVSYDEWWNGLGPLLAPDAVQAYAYVDNEIILVDQVTGPAEIVDDTTAYVAIVAVPTNIGVYEITLSRLDGDSPWLTHRLTPPQED